MADRPLKYKEIPLTGRWITSVDPASIDLNFQALKNLRYTGNGVRAIGGMSKINTSALSTHPKIRNLYQFLKGYPSAESHVLAQAYNSAENESKIFDITTAVPGQGNFGSALFTDSSGAGRGRFSIAPDGALAYCNGVDSAIWGGNEFRCSKFIHYDPSGTFKYDYTDRVVDSLQTAGHVVNLAAVLAGIDSNVMLLLHLNNNVTDSSPTTPHTVTNTNGTFVTTYKLGSHSYSVVAANSAYLSIPDAADFDFSGGNFTIDTRFYSSLAVENTLWHHGTDANNFMRVYITTAGAVKVDIHSGGSHTVHCGTPDGVIAANTGCHIEVVESGDNWYIFVDGVIKAYVSDADRAANYTGSAYIGYDGSAYSTMVIDEFRVSNIARHTSNFSPPSAEYTTATTGAYFYVGSIRPLDGIKFYISTANTGVGDMDVDYWNGSMWTPVSGLSDGTSVLSGGFYHSLGQTGLVSFTSTAAVAKVKVIDQVALFWYRVYVDVADTSTGIYQVTLSDVFQAIQDIWDGETRTCASAQIYKNSTYNDNTLNVLEEDYVSGSTGTYADMSSLTTAGYLIVGFLERMSGLIVNMVDAKGNTAAAIMTTYYWNGASFVAHGSGGEDGTNEGGKSLSKSGTITWPAIDESLEFKLSVGNGEPVYFYKIAFNASLSANTYIDFIGGIPAQKQITGYKFPMFAHNRLFLVSEQADEKNSVLVSAEHTNCVFNGVDSTILYFNDDQELIAGAALYSQFGSNLYNMTVFFKRYQTWALIGNGPEDWTQFQASDSIGCIAPLSVQTAHVGFELAPGQSKNIVIWQSDIGIHLFDGREIKFLSDDISDWFDKRKSYSINRTKIADSTSFFDEDNQEYHWLFASGAATTLDKEFVYDIKKQRWYEVDRGTGLRLQIGCSVKDTNGNSYNYASIDTGYVERLENGNTFDGTSMVFTLHLGDMAYDGMMAETGIRKVKLVMVAKSTTANSVSMTHYPDTSSTGDAAISYLPTASGKRIADVVKTVGLTPGIFHGLKFVITTNDEAYGFEPLFVGVGYKITREDTN